MRVFLVVASCHPDYGGPAFLVTRLARELQEHGIQVFLWAPDGSAVTTPLLPASSKVERLNYGLRRALQAAQKVDVIHDNGIWLPHSYHLARYASRTGIPRIVSIHGMLDPWCLRHKRLKKALAWFWYQKSSLKNARVHHVTSEMEAIHVAKFRLGVRIATIPIGVDLEGLQTGNPSRNRLGGGVRTAVYLGRISPVKGLPMLVKAWDIVRPSGWRLRIAGPDECGHRGEIEGLIRAYGLGESVSISGPLQGIAKRAFLSDADLFILPSHSESFGLAIAEALGHHLPVLTTTAAPWAVLDAEACGWSVQPSVQALAKGLLQATSQDIETLSIMGTRGHQWVENNLRWGKIAKMFVTEYQKFH
jgi:glycosyltransferase involved in cell wall biosynthesis